ncbi:MAG: Crp/Fnr family transcriptional regulator [Proteobacteria bacterium]|nr:Crp/Fnr family transcriptional regulator [Pseudomonadota bacterium]
MTGASVVLGHSRSSVDMVVQMEGEALAISSMDLRRLVVVSTSMRECFLRQAYLLFIQTAHGSMANVKGSLENRLARRLLLAHDRSLTAKLAITHENLADVLGVRRAGVTVALQRLEWQGAIKMARRLITIVNREKLESCAGGLYYAPEHDPEFETTESQNLLSAVGTAKTLQYKKPLI